MNPDLWALWQCVSSQWDRDSEQGQSAVTRRTKKCCFKLLFWQILPLYCIPFGLWLVGTSWVLSGEDQCFFYYYYYFSLEAATCTNP